MKFFPLLHYWLWVFLLTYDGILSRNVSVSWFGRFFWKVNCYFSLARSAWTIRGSLVSLVTEISCRLLALSGFYYHSKSHRKYCYCLPVFDHVFDDVLGHLRDIIVLCILTHIFNILHPYWIRLLKRLPIIWVKYTQFTYGCCFWYITIYQLAIMVVFLCYRSWWNSSQMNRLACSVLLQKSIKAEQNLFQHFSFAQLHYPAKYFWWFPFQNFQARRSFCIPPWAYQCFAATNTCSDDSDMHVWIAVLDHQKATAVQIL